MIEASLPKGGLLGLGKALCSPTRQPRWRDSSAPPPCHFAHQLSTYLADTLNQQARRTGTFLLADPKSLIRTRGYCHGPGRPV